MCSENHANNYLMLNTKGAVFQTAPFFFVAAFGGIFRRGAASPQKEKIPFYLIFSDLSFLCFVFLWLFFPVPLSVRVLRCFLIF